MRTARDLAKWTVPLTVAVALVNIAASMVLGDEGTAASAESGGVFVTGPAYGQLIVGSELVAELTLVDEAGKYRVLTQPGESESLPEGKYRLTEFALTGSYANSRFTAGSDQWFEITPDQPYELKLADLLKPTVSMTRQGRLLELDYALTDADGGTFAGRDAESPPRFTVYKDGQEIGSGSFEYG